MVQSLNEFLDENIQYLKDNGLYNEIDSIEGANGPEIKINGKNYVNLSSNNYLGLATNEDLKEAAKKQLIHTEWVQVQYAQLMVHWTYMMS